MPDNCRRTFVVFNITWPPFVLLSCQFCLASGGYPFQGEDVVGRTGNCACSDSARGIVMNKVCKIVGFAFLLLHCLPGYLRAVNVTYVFSASDVTGLQSLWGAWNKSTPDTSSNLLNWYTPRVANEIPWPCYSEKNWRGVTCLRYQVSDTLWNTWVVGLELNDASIAGILPPEINQLNKLVSLTLTENRNLGGTLPKELGDLPLNILDLHDNGFNETIPAELSKLGNLLQLDLSGNYFSGGFPTQFKDTSALQVFNIARNFLHGNIPPDVFANMKQLLTLDLSGNRFTGPPPKFNTFANSTLYNLNLSRNYFTGLPDLSQVFNDWLPKSLGVLDLSGLNIGGRLPVDWNSSSDLLSLEMLYLDNITISGILNISSIQSVLNLTKSNNLTSRTLQVLSLRNNDITDVFFDKQFLKDGQVKFYLQDNPYCTTESKDPDGRRCFCEQYCDISDPPKKTDWKAIVIPTAICGFLLGTVIFYLVIILHKKNKHVYALVKKLEDSGVRAKRFEYNELRAATKNFADERKLGEGGYGAVYKGILTNNTVIAVKQLLMKNEQASEDFLNEILLITNLQHRNLVSLKGYCLHGKEMLLVYEFVDYCDLDKLLLQGSNLWQVVGWPARMRICLGVAQGLYYLHASSQTKIIHRDIKASNILLDKNLNAKIADFGLARPMQESEILTQQHAGTLGYAAPEYILYGQLSEKADVYSFGVLLLEIVSGTRNKDPTQPEDEIYLPTRAIKLYIEERLLEIMDSRLHVSESEAMDVRRVLETAVMCVRSSPESRPTMFRVVTMLAGDGNCDSVSNDDSNIWPEYQMPSESTTEDPFLATASSSTTRSNRTDPITNGNATIELSMGFSGR